MDLLDEVSARVEQAASFPRSGSPLVGFEDHHDVRKHVVRRFRYVVTTALVDGVLTVIAVAHTSREPGYWRERLVRGWSSPSPTGTGLRISAHTDFGSPTFGIKKPRLRGV